MDKKTGTQVLIPKDVVGAVIGKGGAVLRDITRESNAIVSIQPRDAVGTTPTERIVVISGGLAERTAAFKALHAKADEEARAMGNAAKDPDDSVHIDESHDDNEADGNAVVPLKLILKNELIGVVIGKGGATIKKMSADTGTKISINQPEMAPGPETLRLITVTGPPEGLAQVFEAITSRVEDARPASQASKYGSVPFPSPSSRRERTVILVLESMIGAVIGKGGVNARSITDDSGAKIHIETRTEKEARLAEADGDEVHGADERHVTIIGTAEQQFHAQHRLYELLVADDRHKASQAQKDGRNTRRGPRRMKVHYPISVAILGSVIGKRGAKIEEIATNSGAKLNLLRWTDEKPEDDVVVEIFGNFEETQAAQNLIRQVVLERLLRQMNTKD